VEVQRLSEPYRRIELIRGVRSDDPMIDLQPGRRPNVREVDFESKLRITRIRSTSD
jgi:hypothetical protein